MDDKKKWMLMTYYCPTHGDSDIIKSSAITKKDISKKFLKKERSSKNQSFRIFSKSREDDLELVWNFTKIKFSKISTKLLLFAYDFTYLNKSKKNYFGCKSNIKKIIFKIDQDRRLIHID